LDPSFRENVTAYVGFDDDASAALREAHPLVAPHFVAIVDDFYATIEAHPDARAAIAGGAAQIERLKQSLLRWIDELFRGPHDDAYYDRRARIGRMHVRIDLPQRYMFTAMDRIRVHTSAVLREAPGVEAAARARMLTALHKILDLELAIMLETYREDLVARNRTAERLATIGQFAAGIGHELRNPLAVVETSAFLVTRRLEELHVADPVIERHMQKITGEVQRSTRTITDLLELARRRAPKRRTIDARAFVTDAVARAALPAGVKVTVEVAAGLPLDADAEQLERVITNLLVNAGQAMNGVGQVWIEGEREAAATTLRVRDDGPGVPADVGDRVFEALFTTKARGSGLGLALCRRIVEAHGGTIALAPSPRGALFRIWIPDQTGAEA
jgi:signal transduction histidine kinase